MSEKNKCDGYVKKLQGICDEHDLTYRLRLNEYPLSLTIKPVQGLYEQMSMLEKDEGVLSPDAYLRFEIKDGEVNTTIGGTFIIEDVLFTKLRTLFKNIEYRWLQFFFRDIVENGTLKKDQLPAVSDDLDGPEPDDDASPDEDMDWEEQIQLATGIVRAENSASVDLLATRLGVNRTEAEIVLGELENRSVINEIGQVLPWDEPDDPEDEQEETDEDP